MPLAPESSAAILRDVETTIREKTFDYLKRRLEQDDVMKIREDHRKQAQAFTIKDDAGKAALQRLDQERQQKIMDLIRGDIDVNALRDEIRMRFPENADPTTLLHEMHTIKGMRVEDLLEAHAHREYTVSDEELERLRNLPQPLPMFNGEPLVVTPGGSKFFLYQLTNPEHIALEGATMNHCIADNTAQYKDDIVARLEDGTMKSACFSVRVHYSSTDIGENTGESQWTIWYDRKSETVQQVKGYRNKLITDSKTPAEQSVLVALGRLLKDPETQKRWPIRAIKDLGKIQLQHNEVLFVGDKAEASIKAFWALQDSDVVLSGSVALDANFSDDEIRRIVSIRGIRTTTAKLLNTKKMEVYVDAVLTRSRRDLADSYLKVYVQPFDLKSYRAVELIQCARNNEIAARMLKFVGADVEDLGESNLRLLVKTIFDAKVPGSASHVLTPANGKIIKRLGVENTRMLIQTISEAAHTTAAREVLAIMKVAGLKQIGKENISLLIGTISDANDSQEAKNILQSCDAARVKVIGKENIHALIQTIVRAKDDIDSAARVLKYGSASGLKEIGTEYTRLLVRCVCEDADNSIARSLYSTIPKENEEAIGQTNMAMLRSASGLM